MQRRNSGFGLSKWNIYAGGTSAAYGKHSYDLIVGDKKYSIAAYTTKYGRHAGYLLSVFPGRNYGHSGINKDGNEVMVTSLASSFRSPHLAAKAACLHYGKSL